MIKTISINLSGQVFQIDENAYEQLQQYLASVRKRFEKEEGGDEIVADIESRIAEMLAEKISQRKQSVTLADIDAVIQIMGKPEQFEEDYAEEEEAAQNTSATKTEKLKRRMFRNPDDKVLGGVCSGLSNYFGIDDPLWLRIIMVVFLFLSFGTAFWIYIILWVIIPEAKTASDKLQMKGEPVNIDNIEKTFKDDLKDFQQKIENINNNKGTGIRNVFQKILAVTITLVKLFARAISKIAALLLIAIGVGFAIFLVFGLVLPAGVIGITFPLLFELIFENSTQVFLGGLGILLLLAVPAFGLIFSGIRTLLGSKTRYRALGISLTGLWVVGIVLCIYVGSMLARSFSVKETTKETIALNIENDTLFLKPFEMIDEYDAEPQISFGSPIFFGKDEKTFNMAMRNLDVVKSETGEVELLIKKSARSFNRNNASKKSKTVNYEVSLSDSAISFPTHFEVVTKDKYRAQNVSVSLKIPEGKIIYFSEGMEDIIYDVKNITNTFDGDMIGHYWKMTSEGLACISCHDFDSDDSGSNISLKYDLSGYNQIQIDGNLNVEIQQGDSYSFYIEGDNDFAKNFNAQTSGNQLTIASDFKWKNITGGSKKGTVYITTPTLTHLEINGLNNVTIKGLKTDNLKIESNGASANNFNIEVKNLTLELNGASKVILRGSAHKAVMESSGASRINASGLEINNANIDLNAASTAHVWVKENLKTNLSGASKIIYKGNPKIQSQTNGGSSISREE
jgi:phage shock protein PspC (stress-responsive transcriptional regulator)